MLLDHLAGQMLLNRPAEAREYRVERIVRFNHVADHVEGSALHGLAAGADDGAVAIGGNELT